MSVWTVTSELDPCAELIVADYEAGWEDACRLADALPGVTFFVRQDGMVLAAARAGGPEF